MQPLQMEWTPLPLPLQQVLLLSIAYTAFDVIATHKLRLSFYYHVQVEPKTLKAALYLSSGN